MRDHDDEAMMDLLRDVPHRRYNPLLDEWVLVSPHRTLRPWQGQVEAVAGAAAAPYDPTCYLCPGNARAGGVRNPAYTGTFVFDNDYAALLPDVPAAQQRDATGLMRAHAERGICRVICYSPRHDLSLAALDTAGIAAVVDLWAAQTDELGARAAIGSVQIFENRGAMMGASNPHPHGQIWATEHLPTIVAREDQAQRAYFATHGRTLLGDYLAAEEADGARIVWAGASFVALVPFWAVWPFETMIIGRRPAGALGALDGAERHDLAEVIRRVAAAYDRVFGAPFPYSMGLHQQPCDGAAHPAWQLHAHFFPPLLRSATVRKFLVGFEMLGEPQRDITAEYAAARLRDLAGSVAPA